MNGSPSRLGKAVGALLRKGGYAVGYCKSCQSAWGGKEVCPSCGGSLIDVNTGKVVGSPTVVEKGDVHSEAKTAPLVEQEAAKVVCRGVGRGRRYAITFQGETLAPREWSIRLNLDAVRLMGLLRLRMDVTPYLQSGRLKTAAVSTLPTISSTPPTGDVVGAVDSPGIQALRQKLTEIDAITAELIPAEKRVQDLKARKACVVTTLPREYQ